ncbi:MAG: efflux RND transporter periplasmic adaptor subunit [Patescibacteria group bacterium]
MGGSVGLTQSTTDTYRTNINTARTNINTALSSASNQKQTISSRGDTVQKIQDELNLKLAGSTKEQIASQEAQLKQAEAKVALVEAQIQKSVLYSPIAGTVTKQNLRVGEVASPNTTFLSIISESQLEIETNIPEISIGKIASGNNVEITLDAFPGETFTGKVFYIDPAETLVNGVVNFKVKISFDKPDSRLKSGLTTNLIIQTASEPNALILPIYTITEKDSGTFAMKLENDELKETPVTVGMKDAKGSAQILSGVAEGDKVVNPLSIK